MAQITTKIRDEILKEFRDVVYTKYGLRRGDLKLAIEEAMTDYIQKYRKPSS